jgi:putative ABC transport system permease protein
VQDLRQALSSFRRNPGFTAAAVLTLALAIGATTAVYSLVYGVLLRPLPFVEPQRLVRLWEEQPGGNTLAGNRWLSHRTYHSWIGSPRTLTSIGGYINSSGIVRIGDEGVALPGAALTPSLVGMIGAAPELGRWFNESEALPNAARVVVLSHRVWQERFSSRAEVIGTVIRIDDQPCSVIGVAPPSLRFPDERAQFWVPYAVPTIEAEPVRTVGFNAVARLSPGATAEQVEAEGTAAARALVRPPSSDVVFGKGGPVVVHARALAQDIAAPVRPAVLALAAAVALVLVAACANVANLLLSRGVARQRELAIRIALGAGRGRLIRQLLVESSMLAIAGGVMGIWLAWALVKALPAIAPERFPRLNDVTLDLHVLAVAGLVTVAAALVSGLVPALRGAGAAAATAVRGGGDGSTTEGFRTKAAGRIRDGLLALEAAFAVVLLVGALLLGHSLARLMAVDAGYTADEVVSATIRMPRGAQQERTAAFLDALVDRLAHRPDVAAFGAATTMPMVGLTAVTSFPIAPSPQSDTTVMTRSITYVATPGYAEAVGLRLREGRFFTRDDQRPGVRSLIVNEEFVRRYLRGPVIGRRFERLYSGEESVPTEIVGVVGNVLKDGNALAPEPEIYFVHGGPTRSLATFFSLAVRTTGQRSALITSLRDITASIDSGAVVERVDRLADRVSASMAQPRFATTVVAAFAGLGMMLAGVGLFAVLSYGVSQRRRELSVRAALGASRGRLLRLVLGHGLSVTCVGLVVGLAAAAAMVRLLEALLFQVQPLDPLSFTAAPLVLLPAAVLASLLPAMRAASVDPARVLRGE